jgi:signal peptidase I
MPVPRTVGLGLAAALLLAFAWLFWPATLGGGTSYLTTHGVSMQPRFSTGDLAILRPAGSYDVGDVIAYDSPTLHTTVMHRIVARDGDRFVTRGDNNTWVDPDHPSKGQIVGSLWLRIPSGGKALAMLRSPGVLALVSVASLVLVAPVRAPRRGRRRTRRAGRRLPSSSLVRSLPARARARQAALACGVVATVAGTALAVLAVLPTTQRDPSPAQVTQQGRFTYSGTAQRGTTYPTGALTTGDPVYTRLTHGLTVSFADAVTGEGLTAVAGTLRLDLSLSVGDGWTSPLGSGPTTTVVGTTATASVPLDLAAAADVLERHNGEVGAQGGGATLTVTPVVGLTGTVGGSPVVLGSPEPLSFTLETSSLRLDGGAASPALAPAVTTPVTADRLVPHRIGVLGFPVTTSTGRQVAYTVLVVALAGLAAGMWIARSGGDAADEFVVRNAARILPVTGITPGHTVVDVSDAEALHRLAEKLDSFVLHQTGPEGATFAVQDVDTTYRFVLPPGARAARPAPGWAPGGLPFPASAWRPVRP